ncbi:MAG: hypothetical protein ACFFBR_04145 [Promethearchaeota archaeon]
MTNYRCPMCGTVFEKAQATGCAGCMMARACGAIACPSCGYEFPDVPEEA